MSKSRRRLSRRGDRLRAGSAHLWLRVCPEALVLHGLLASLGFRLMAGARAYRRSDGNVTIRFVWRNRSARRSIEIRVSERRQQ